MEFLIEKLVRKDVGPVKKDALLTLLQMAYGVLPTLVSLVVITVYNTGISGDTAATGLIRTFETMIVGAIVSWFWANAFVQVKGVSKEEKIPRLQFKDFMNTILRSIIFLLPMPMTVYLGLEL